LGPSGAGEAAPARAAFSAAEQANAVEPTPIASRRRRASPRRRRTKVCVATARTEYRHCSGRTG
jgi:hypothetical protein